MTNSVNWTAAANIDRAFPIIFVQIQVAGKPDQRLDVSDKVLSLSYEDSESKADKCSLTVDNFNLANFDQPVWAKGTVLEVSWGYPGNLAPMREVVIQKVTGFQQLKIEGYSKAILMHKIKKSRVFEGVSRTAAIQQIAEENGFSAELQQIEDTVDILPTITQVRETDASFIARMAKQEGFEFYIDFDGFHFHQRQLDQAPLRVYHFYTDPGRGDVISISVENDISGIPGKVSVKGRDPKKKTSIGEIGSNVNTQHDGVAPQKEAVSSEDHLKLDFEGTGQDFSTSTTTTAKASSGVVAETTVSMGNSQSANTSKKQADGHYKKAILKTVQLSLAVRGDPALLAKTIFELRGVGKRLSGNYYLTEVSHQVSPGNYSCNLKAKSDGHSGYAALASNKAASGVAFGVPRVDSEAQVNPQTGDNANPDQLTMVSSLDPEGRGKELAFRDTKGRKVAGALGKAVPPEEQ